MLPQPKFSRAYEAEREINRMSRYYTPALTKKDKDRERWVAVGYPEICIVKRDTMYAVMKDGTLYDTAYTLRAAKLYVSECISADKD